MKNLSVKLLLKSVTRIYKGRKKKIPKIILKTQFHEYNPTLKTRKKGKNL